MYVTRPMSLYLENPEAVEERPPEGPGSGFLVVVDEEAAASAPTRCFGLCRDRQVYGIPFPQSRQLVVLYKSTPHPAETCVGVVSEVIGSCAGVASGRPPGMMVTVEADYVMFVPVVGMPLSSSRYYVVRAEGKHIGQVSACSKEDDKTTCCFCSIVNDVPPRPFDGGDVYQQVEVQQLKKGYFKAGAVAADGIPPEYLRRKGWKVSTTAYGYKDLTNDARGVDWPLRRRMPDLVDSAPPVTVGRWYVPFMFVKVPDDGSRKQRQRRYKDTVRRCMFYKMTLEQSWEEVYSCSNPPEEVAVSATVRRSTALLGGTYAVEGGGQVVGGAMWFRPAAVAPAVEALGLDMVVWERMRWEMEKGGWVAGDEEEARIERVERRDDGRQWAKFGCYVLVETFVLRRMDGSVALSCQFRHTDKIRTKWD